MLGQTKQQIARDLRVERRIKVPRRLRREHQRQAKFPALRCQSGNEPQATGAMSFIEDDRMRDATLNPASKHLLVDVVERQHGNGLRHSIVLRHMIPQHAGSRRRQRAISSVCVSLVPGDLDSMSQRELSLFAQNESQCLDSGERVTIHDCFEGSSKTRR